MAQFYQLAGFLLSILETWPDPPELGSFHFILFKQYNILN